MKLIIIIALLSSSQAFAWGYESKIENNPINSGIIERQINQERNFNQNLMRELRETGKIERKDYTDTYNYRQGYGYDGGHIQYQNNRSYDYGY